MNSAYGSMRLRSLSGITYGEDERVDQQQQQRVDERPEEAEDRAAVARLQLARDQALDQAAVARRAGRGYGTSIWMTSTVCCRGRRRRSPPRPAARRSARASPACPPRMLRDASRAARRPKTVGAQQEPLARRGRQLHDVDLGIAAARQRAGHDVAPRMLPRRSRGHRPGADLFLDPRVIVGDLPQRAVTQRVDAAVADVRDAGAVSCRPAPPTRSSPCRADRPSPPWRWRSGGWRAGRPP